MQSVSAGNWNAPKSKHADAICLRAKKRLCTLGESTTGGRTSCRANHSLYIYIDNAIEVRRVTARNRRTVSMFVDAASEPEARSLASLNRRQNPDRRDLSRWI